MKYIFGKLIPIIILTLFSTILVFANDAKLAKADTLFVNQKYTDAFAIYEEIFEVGQVSPAMLTRMAFIQEGLGNYTSAIYYLHLYHDLTADKKAQIKIREIAEEHGLYGYEYSDAEFFKNFIKANKQSIIWAVLSLSLMVMAYGFYQKKKNQKPVTALVVQILVVSILAILVNGWFQNETAIITQEQSILMSGPSAAAEPIDVTEKGHKVRLLEQDELWSKILFEDQEAYIRNKNLQKL